jgi:hypothetical protein
VTRPVRGDWLAAERREHSVKRELQRLKRRARARPISAILLALALAGAIVGYRAYKPRSYPARVVLRVTEGTLSQDRSPLPKKDLRDYVVAIAFSKRRLLEVVEAHDLYPLREVRGADYAVEALRSNIEVEVYRNYFATDRGLATTERSARIAVTFRDRDPNRAYRVARSLAGLVVASESEVRQIESKVAATRAQAALARAQSHIAERQRQLASAQLELQRAKTARDEVAVAKFTVAIGEHTKALEFEETMVRDASRQLASIELRGALEDRQLGLQFGVVDDRVIGVDDQLWVTLTAIGLIAFVLGLPLCAIVVAAFDARIRDLEDVQRLGFPTVGHVPDVDGVALPGRGPTGDRVT